MIKKRPKIVAIVSFVLVLGTSIPPMLTGQELPSVLPVEPPSSLFSARIGDEDVEVFAQGFWEADLLTTGAWSPGSSFNAVPIFFRQTPDLYVFLGFREKWLFEAYVTQEADKRSFLLAFEGAETDFVQSARLGNTDIAMPAYPYLGFGQPAGSFGIALNAYDADRELSVDAMIRWDGLAWNTRTIFGGTEAQETEVKAGDTVRGRYFVLPDKAITALSLSVSTLEGSRTLAADEYSVSLSNGTILLAKEPSGTLAASYTRSSGAPVELVLYDFALDANGNPVRMYNPYEARNIYAMTSLDAARQYFVRNLSTGTTDMRFTVSRIAEGLLEVVRDGAPADPADDAYMRPFSLESPWIYNEDTTADPYVKQDGFLIIARTVESVDSIILDEGTVEGTISVYRDNVESVSFIYDSGQRSLTLMPAPGPGELVQVRYAVASAERSKGALAFALGTRFPWLGLDWSAALGGRWPIAGTGYDEGGELSPAWTGLSLGTGAGSDTALFDAKAMLRYQRAGTFGLYRILGMEEYGVSEWLVPVRPVEGDTEGIVTGIVDAADLQNSSAFGNMIEDLHPTGSDNLAFALTPGSASTGAPARFIRYLDFVPLSSFRTLSFFVKADGVFLGTAMTLTLGDGTGAGVKVSLPLDGLGSGWHKVQVSLDPLASLVVLADDGTHVALTGAESTFVLPDAAGLLELVIEGLTAGTLTIDEIVLEDEVDGFVALAGGSFFISSVENPEGTRDGSQDPAADFPGSVYVQGTGSGVFDAEPAMAAGIEAGWISSMAEMQARANPAWGLDTGSLGLGYSLAVPSRIAPLRIVDEYSRDNMLGRYARSLEAALSAGGFSILARAVSAEDAGTSRQNWKAAANLGSIVSAGVSASLLAPVSLVTNLGFLDAWVASWDLMLPQAESIADSRRFEMTMGMFGSALTAMASREYAQSSAETTISARASLPLAFGVLGFTPIYTRSTSSGRDSGSPSFLADIDEFVAEVNRGLPLWEAIPIVELWKPEALESFTGFSTGAKVAEYRSGPGLELRRPIGYGLVDLIIPTTLESSFLKVMSIKNDTLLRSTLLDFAFAGGAANLFSGSGVQPVFKTIVFDEYSYRTRVALTFYPEDGAVLPSITANHALSYEGSSGSVMAIASNFSFILERDANPWSESLGFALTTKPARTWFGDLVGLAIKPGAEIKPPDGNKDTWVSEWFEKIFAEAPALQETFMVDTTVGKSNTPNPPLDLTLALDYSSKAIAAGSLTAGVNARVEQKLHFANGATGWDRIAYEIGIMAKVVF